MNGSQSMRTTHEILRKDLVFLSFQLIVLVVSKDDRSIPNADKKDQQ